MVDGIENNNGDVLACIIMLCDSMARDNNSGVIVETYHQENCILIGNMEEQKWPEKLDKPDLEKPETIEHLYFCNCDTKIRVIYCKPDGEMFWLPLLLSDIKKECPWMNDDKATEGILTMIKSVGPDNPIIVKMKALFQRHLGYPYTPGFSSEIGMTLEEDVRHINPDKMH